MGYKDMYIKKEYRSFSDDIVNNFYIPLLDKANLYQRAVGFFSSTALIEISYGISRMVDNAGRIQLIASPRLQEDDIQAIAKGYEERDVIIERAILNAITEPRNYFEEQRLNLLATLIAQDRLDIKIAFLESDKKIGMYHEKLGLIYSEDNEIVAFTGSLNETGTAFSHNYETIDVFCSWTEDAERVEAKKCAFSSLWNNTMSKMKIIDFPNVAREKLQTYKKKYIDLDVDIKEYPNEILMETKTVFSTNNDISIGPRAPEGFQFHDYQTKAIDAWEKQGFQGIFDMATGTGKTYTGLGAASRLSQVLDDELAIIIVCPYQHLVEQWVGDIVMFNLKPIVGYSSSAQKDWKQQLSIAVRDHKLKVKNRRNFCFICTNATFTSDYVQLQIEKMKGNILLLVDEAHNFGSTRLSLMLSEKISYRLALSATLERHNDEEGTDKLKGYFGPKCIEYPLERAIKEKKLTPYKYYPIIVNLNESELEAYTLLSQEINKCVIVDKNGKKKLSEKGERLALKRARLVAAAKSKISKLKEVIQPYVHDSYLLIYCGAASLLNENDDYTIVDEDDIRQIDAVTLMLGNELNMKVSQFTSKEDVEEREILKREFEQGTNLQALIAIKCLDEGVNIPKIKVAFILASTTNPKEYIQRRGRVLRLAEGKDYAEVYDFITTPRPLDEVSSLTIEEMKKDYSLIKNELNRADEFARIAMNAMEADKILQEIKDSYYLNDV
ncbi:DEAD/DEAH box helicase family protein [Paenibacillus sp. SZ31]|uniref:DEAD/DEAH box helicase family protein n=1 Tax=Paenibacillus sp. SZ31 TaxID=2725555 RepID=UPI00146F3157|nr:DEAD/DEAH box helicase family protein [Paenibacillus sp. SZ31]NMI07773.1 DEAD/DEAH box helicase family protein [Paenibacillus sp. SZ31]